MALKNFILRKIYLARAFCKIPQNWVLSRANRQEKKVRAAISGMIRVLNPMTRECPQRSIRHQRGQTMAEMLREIPTACDWGVKKNARGRKTSWRGYKLQSRRRCTG
jgi:hypothetical protein